MEAFIYFQLKSEQDIIAHELLLYDSFVNRAKHGWIYDHYYKENNRMKAPFPYEKQLLFGIKNNNGLRASIALNLDTENTLQLEYIGFSRNRIDTQNKFAEVLSLCATGEKVPPNAMDIIRGFNMYVIEKCKEYGLQDIYGTTFKRKKLFYHKMGFKVVDEIKNNYGKVFLLQQELV
ncbi:MAG: hypothetical protein JXB88_19115 [Spirochaetales bacterium]|nr:hypothetical protein [Spirochaetales bacterium]